MRVAHESKEAPALLKTGEVVCNLRGVFGRSPGGEVFVIHGFVWALFDFENDGVGLFDNHAMPDARFEVDERGFGREEVSGSDLAFGGEDEDFE